MLTAEEIEAQIQDRLVPIQFQPTYRKAMQGNSRAAAIKAKCQDCVGFEHTVNRIRFCECVGCPLHAVRPYQAGGEDEEEVEAVVRGE